MTPVNFPYRISMVKDLKKPNQLPQAGILYAELQPGGSFYSCPVNPSTRRCFHGNAETNLTAAVPALLL